MGGQNKQARNRNNGVGTTVHPAAGRKLQRLRSTKRKEGGTAGDAAQACRRTRGPRNSNHRGKIAARQATRDGNSSRGQPARRDSGVRRVSGQKTKTLQERKLTAVAGTPGWGPNSRRRSRIPKRGKGAAQGRGRGAGRPAVFRNPQGGRGWEDRIPRRTVWSRQTGAGGPPACSGHGALIRGGVRKNAGGAGLGQPPVVTEFAVPAQMWKFCACLSVPGGGGERAEKGKTSQGGGDWPAGGEQV